MSTMMENHWDPRLQNQNGPITSGFVSNSDIRQRERADQIKWERQREYEDMMNKNIKVNYMDTHGLSLPVGGYEESRKVYDDQRQKECIEFMAQKREAENKRKEELYLNSQRNYKPPPEPEMYDHHQISKDLREERQKEYNDYLKRKHAEEASRIKHRHRYTPPGSLPIGEYEIQRKKLQAELRRDYKDSLLKQRQEQLFFRAKEHLLDTSPAYLGNLSEERPLVGSPSPRFTDLPKREKDNQILSSRRPPPTPPGGLNIATEQERKKLENLKKSMYREELLKQKNQQLFHRAQQEGILPVLNSGSPIPTNRMSPRSPPRGRPPPHPNSRVPPHDDRTAQGSMPQDKQKPIDEVRTGFFDDRRQSPLNRDERQHEYQEYLAKKQHDDDMRRQKLDEQRHAPRPDISKGDYYDADAYERKKQNLNSQRREEYQDYLSKQKEKGSSRQEEELDDYQSKRRHALAQERNQEYNQFLIQQANRPSYRMYTPEDMQGLPLSQNRYEAQRKDQERQRNKEYNEHLAKKGEKVTSEEDPLSRRDLTLKKYMENQMRSEMHDKFRDPSGNEIGPDNFGLPIGQFRYEDWQKHLKEERTKEYHELQAQKYGNQPVRRAPDQPNPNSIGFVANMGRHEQERSRLGKQRQDEYKKFLDEDSWYRQEPPPFHHSPGPDRAPEQRPDSYGRRQTPSYQDILDSKRREEASYRRFDDPEYSRGGAPPGGPYDRYDHHDRPGSYDRRPLSREPMGRPGERPMSNGRPLGASPLDRYGSDGRPF